MHTLNIFAPPVIKLRGVLRLVSNTTDFSPGIDCNISSNSLRPASLIACKLITEFEREVIELI